MKEIILIDDDHLFSSSLTAILSKSGIDLKWFNNPSNASDYILETSEEKILAIFIDDTNEGTSNIVNTYHFIKSKNIELPLLCLSNNIEKADIKTLNKYGIYFCDKSALLNIDLYEFLEIFENIKALKDKPKINLLIVDDNPDVIEVIKGSLKGLNANIFSAINVDQAIEIYNTNKINLIITDLKMEPKTGIDLSNLIREKVPNFPIVCLSAYGSNLLDVGAQGSLFNKVFSKPLAHNDLSKYIISLLGLKS